jgi:hypothetical protein
MIFIQLGFIVNHVHEFQITNDEMTGELDLKNMGM